MSGVLPDDTHLEETWMSLVNKISKKAELEAGKPTLKQLRKRHSEENAVVSSEEYGEYHDFTVLSSMTHA